jgi:D-threo-aldose 1-dehydrogenase
MTSKHRVIGERRFVTPGGRTIPFTALGFGSAPLGNYLKPLSEEQCDQALTAAWTCGLRYYDTAPLYGFGLSEQRVGRNLRQHDRTEYVLSTKVGRLLEPCPADEVESGFFIDVPNMRFYYDYSYDGVMRSYEESQQRMQLDRADILFVHDIDSFAHGKEGCEERFRELIDQGGWRALSELRDNGDVAALGLGVNEWQPCARLLELADPDLFLLAGRYTLLEQEPIDTLFPQCTERGVGIVIGGPYNSGVLAGRSTFNYGEIPAEVAAKVKQLDAVCKTHDVLLPQAALHFVLAHPLVVSVIPGPQTQEETEQNVALLERKTPAALWEEMKEKGLIHPQAPTPP